MPVLKKLILVIMAASSVMLAPLMASALIYKLDDVVPHTLNDIPLYGGIEKTPAMKGADMDYRRRIIEKLGSQQKASVFLINQSLDALKNHQLNHATVDANAAYLVDDRDFNAYWTMALIQRHRGAPPDEIEALFRKAFATVDTENRLKLTQDYDAFHSGTGLPYIENLSEVSAQYLAMRQKLTGK